MSVTGCISSLMMTIKWGLHSFFVVKCEWIGIAVCNYNISFYRETHYFYRLNIYSNDNSTDTVYLMFKLFNGIVSSTSSSNILWGYLVCQQNMF